MQAEFRARRWWWFDGGDAYWKRLVTMVMMENGPAVVQIQVQ